MDSSLWTCLGPSTSRVDTRTPAPCSRRSRKPAPTDREWQIKRTGVPARLLARRGRLEEAENLAAREWRSPLTANSSCCTRTSFSIWPRSPAWPAGLLKRPRAPPKPSASTNARGTSRQRVQRGASLAAEVLERRSRYQVERRCRGASRSSSRPFRRRRRASGSGHGQPSCAAWRRWLEAHGISLGGPTRRSRASREKPSPRFGRIGLGLDPQAEPLAALAERRVEAGELAHPGEPTRAGRPADGRTRRRGPDLCAANDALTVSCTRQRDSQAVRRCLRRAQAGEHDTRPADHDRCRVSAHTSLPRQDRREHRVALPYGASARRYRRR
jgi:hypothetical protein